MSFRIPRPRTPKAQRRVHYLVGLAWFVFGLYGLTEYVIERVAHTRLLDVANSIPVLFAISVYANLVGHLSSAQAAQAEVKVDEAVNVDVNVEKSR